MIIHKEVSQYKFFFNKRYYYVIIKEDFIKKVYYVITTEGKVSGHENFANMKEQLSTGVLQCSSS